MNQETIISTFKISFILYVLFLNITLIVVIKPRFIFGDKHTNPSRKWDVPLYITLFIFTFWLGTLTYLLRIYNNTPVYQKQDSEVTIKPVQE